ncbi:MAG TPA: tyrosine-type recombinase/integrase [bacterium]|nr:tyrosine-type recombinase/integrase [bacterium]
MSDKRVELVEPSESLNIIRATHDFIHAWLERERLNGQADKTIQAYRRGIKRFTKWLLENGVNNPEPRDIARFRADLADTYSSQTVNLSLSAVRSFYRYLVEVGAIPFSIASDIKGVKRPKSKTHKRSELSGSEVLDVLATCDNSVAGIRDRAIITLMAYCGLRTIEVYRANVKDLKTHNNRMILDVWGKGRTEPDESVIIPRDQERVIRAWLTERAKFGNGEQALFVSLSNRSQGERLSARAIRGAIKERYKEAGIISETKTTHSLRHSAITSAIRGGATLLQVQAMARHASSDTTLGYIHEVSRLESPAEDLINYS